MGHGVHFCLGAGIARMLAKASLSALFERFPDLTLAVDPEDLVPYPTFIMNGHRQLPVRRSGALSKAAEKDRAASARSLARVGGPGDGIFEDDE